MTTTKSYLAGLGMTGIVIGSVLVLLAVGTGLVAFQGAQDGGGLGAPLERVVVGEGDHPSAKPMRSPRDADPVVAARPPLAAAPVSSQPAPSGVRSPETAGRQDRHGRAGHGHGGAPVISGRLGGGAPVREASDTGGGVAADSPPVRARGRDTAPGRLSGRAPSRARRHGPSGVRGGTPSGIRGGTPSRVRGSAPSGIRGGTPSRVRGSAPSGIRRHAPGAVRGKAQSTGRIGNGRKLGAARGRAGAGTAVGQGAQPARPAKPGEPLPG